MNIVICHPLDYEQTPRGHEVDHWANLASTLEQRGHTVLPTTESPWPHADLVIFDSGVRNVSGGGTSPYDKQLLTMVIAHKTPVVWVDDFDHAGTPDSWGRWPGSDGWKDMLNYAPPVGQDWKDDWAWFGLSLHRNGNPLLYLMRKMQIHQDYPPYVFPLEYPIFEDYTLASKEAFLDRRFDVCGLANNSGPRAISMTGLYARNCDLACVLNLDLEIIPHYRRLDHPDWIARHARAKLFLEADASLGSERPLRLITVAAMLRIKSDHRIPFPFTDMVNMVEIGDYDGLVTHDDFEKLCAVLKNSDLLYSIYVAGAEFMRKHYSLEARSNYVVDKIEEFVK